MRSWVYIIAFFAGCQIGSWASDSIGPNPGLIVGIISVIVLEILVHRYFRYRDMQKILSAIPPIPEYTPENVAKMVSWFANYDPKFPEIARSTIQSNPEVINDIANDILEIEKKYGHNVVMFKFYLDIESTRLINKYQEQQKYIAAHGKTNPLLDAEISTKEAYLRIMGWIYQKKFGHEYDPAYVENLDALMAATADAMQKAEEIVSRNEAN